MFFLRRCGRSYILRMVRSRRFQKPCNLKGIRLYVFMLNYMILCMALQSLSVSSINCKKNSPHFLYQEAWWGFQFTTEQQMISLNETQDKCLALAKKKFNFFFFQFYCSISSVKWFLYILFFVSFLLLLRLQLWSQFQAGISAIVHMCLLYIASHTSPYSLLRECKKLLFGCKYHFHFFFQSVCNWIRFCCKSSENFILFLQSTTIWLILEYYLLYLKFIWLFFRVQ